MAFAKFQENWFRIDEKIAENHAILVNLTASIEVSIPFSDLFLKKESRDFITVCHIGG